MTDMPNEQLERYSFDAAWKAAGSLGINRMVDLASATGLSLPTLYEWRAEGTCSRKTALCAADGLGVSIETLIEGGGK